jgi:hypothetical protein
MSSQFPHVRSGVRPNKFETTPCILDTISLISISSDVHDIWRSSLNPGETKPFECDVIDVDGGSIDVANTHSRELPETLQRISVASGAIILTMINTHLTCKDEIESMDIEKMSINLFGLWNVIKYGQSLTTERAQQYLDAPARIKILDQRMVLGGVASLFDDDRYPMWVNYYDMDQVRELPGIRRYGRQGQKILDIVRGEQQPVPLHSDLDRLYDA